MKEKIQEALLKLDTSNENHWTQDGLPRLDTIKILASDPSLTRETVSEAAPGFTRTNAVVAAPAADPVPPAAPAAIEPPPVVIVAPAAQQAAEQVTAPTEPPVAEDAPLTPAPIGETTPENEAEQELRSLQLELDDALAEVSDIAEALAQGKTMLDRAQNRAAEIENQISKLPQANNGNAIGQYLASQRKVLAERGELKRTVKESGIDLKKLAASLQSPLDAAYKARARTPRLLGR